MSVKNPVETIGLHYYHDLTWPKTRALLLFLLGMENGPVSGLGQAEETKIEIATGDLSPKSTEFPNLDIFFRKP